MSEEAERVAEVAEHIRQYAHESADEHAKERATEEAQEAARQAYEEVYAEVYAETYKEEYEEAFNDAYGAHREELLNLRAPQIEKTRKRLAGDELAADRYCGPARRRVMRRRHPRPSTQNAS